MAASASTTCPIRSKPKLIHHQLTGGIGVHRFDMDERYAYISTEMDGFVGNYPGHLRPARSEKPAGSVALVDAGAEYRRRRKAELVRQAAPAAPRAALRRRDVRQLLARRFPHRRRGRPQQPKTVASYNYHPPFPEPTHTVMPVPNKIGGKRIALAIDEEDQAQSANEEEARRGRLHAGISIFDVVRLRQREAALAVRSERTRFAVRPHAGRALRRAPVPRTHDRHAGARGVVRRRPAHHRRRRSDWRRARSVISFRSRSAGAPRRRAMT